jgi:hypothetical protein
MATTTAPRRVAPGPTTRKRLLTVCRRLIRGRRPFRPPAGQPAAHRLTLDVFRRLTAGERVYIAAVWPQGADLFAGRTLRLLENVCAQTFNARTQVADASGRNLGEMDLVLAARMISEMHRGRCTWRRALARIVEDGHAPAELLSCLEVKGG